MSWRTKSNAGKAIRSIRTGKPIRYRKIPSKDILPKIKNLPKDVENKYVVKIVYFDKAGDEHKFPEKYWLDKTWSKNWKRIEYSMGPKKITVTDLPIDPPVVKTSLLMNNIGLETIQSCGGHLEGDPWLNIHFGKPLPIAIKHRKSLQGWALTDDGYLRPFIGFYFTGDKSNLFKKISAVPNVMVVKPVLFKKRNISAIRFYNVNTRKEANAAIIKVNRILQKELS